MSEGHFKQQNHQQKAQKYLKCGTKITAQRTIVYSLRVETRKQSFTFLDLKWDSVCQVAQDSHL